MRADWIWSGMRVGKVDITDGGDMYIASDKLKWRRIGCFFFLVDGYTYVFL